ERRSWCGGQLCYTLPKRSCHAQLVQRYRYAARSSSRTTQHSKYRNLGNRIHVHEEYGKHAESIPAGIRCGGTCYERSGFLLRIPDEPKCLKYQLEDSIRNRRKRWLRPPLGWPATALPNSRVHVSAHPIRQWWVVASREEHGLVLFSH